MGIFHGYVSLQKGNNHQFQYTINFPERLVFQQSFLRGELLVLEGIYLIGSIPAFIIKINHPWIGKYTIHGCYGYFRSFDYPGGSNLKQFRGELDVPRAQRTPSWEIPVLSALQKSGYLCPIKLVFMVFVHPQESQG